MKYICRILSFGNGGHSEHYKKQGNTSSSLSGYDKPENWKPKENTDYSQCIVINKIPALDTPEGYRHVFTGPMVSPDLEGDGIEECPTPSDIMANALQGNAYGSLLNLQAAQKTVGKTPGALDSVSPEVYANGWRSLGAKIGRVENNKIVWES